ncbi:MAG TPA: NF038122 family metalloprotease [Acetobacteraceae bacterium]
MPFEPEDRSNGRDHLHNGGTIDFAGSGWSGNSWGEIGGIGGAYPFPGFTPPLVPIAATSASHQEAGTVTTGGTADDSQPSSDAGTVEPVQGIQSQAKGPAFDIVINYDSSISTLETTNNALWGSITSAISVAVSFYEAEIKNTMTVAIDFGWGEEDNGTLAPGAISQSTPGTKNLTVTDETAVNYGSLVAAMEAHDPALDGELPATDPESGGTGWDVALSEAIALGIGTIGHNVTVIGFIGLSNTAPFTFDPNNRAVPGEYDAIGALEHEISEVMGRVDLLGTTEGAGLYSPMDLLRFDGAGTHDYASGKNSYISFDDGTTGATTAALNDSLPSNQGGNGGDPGDWASSVTADSYDAGASMGVADTVSAIDLQLLNALGYDVAAACYAAGTRIRGTRGDLAVEDLAIGHIVHTRFNGPSPIRWIGQREIDCRRHPDPQQVWPIRIAAHAFAPSQPQRDLLLSPDHAVAIGDVLIPIRLLVNGATIRQEPGWPRIHYFHVELDQHDLLLAEGLEAESYLDTGNRGMFQNADAPLMLHPRLNRTDAEEGRGSLSCLPFHTQPAQVLPIWNTLAARAAALGHALSAVQTTNDPALCIVSGACRYPAIRSSDHRYTCVLPPPTDDLRLRSRAGSPAAARPWLDDRRRLGVMVRRIVMHGSSGTSDIALDDPRLTDGWWAVEREGAAMWRWTNGDALLPRVDGPTIVELLIGDTLAYPIDASIVPAARAA